MYAQTIVPQQLGYPRICAGLIVAGKPFNEYNATFSYVDFPAGTVFEVELSNEVGNFTTTHATTTVKVVDNPGLQQQTITFAIPTDLKGSDTYSLRVKALTSTPSYSIKFKNSQDLNIFPIYYRTFVDSFFINNKSATASFCAGGSMTLAIDAATAETPSSPLAFTNLKYKWFKDDVLIAGQSGTTLVVNTAGVYFAQIDYGGCLDENFSSNRVTVSSSAGGSAVTITSSLGNPFCAGGTGTVLTATSGNKYQWKKDGVVIAGATNRTYSTNESGVYSVDIDFGGCNATGSINLSSNGFDASIDVADSYQLKEGETLNVSVTTDASAPTFEWFLNGNLISGASSSSYSISVRGQYKVKISQASGCVATKEFSFRITSETDSKTSVIPNVVKLGGMYPYWNLPDEYKTDATKIIILSSNGDVIYDDIGSNYDPELNSFIKDYKNVNPVYYYVIKSDSGEKKGSITVIK
ncbi:gliding motility protein SprC [Flavobacterium reichenbachii]|nr:gliding motility protein SprC [Flavobacterium reichenbachii]